MSFLASLIQHDGEAFTHQPRDFIEAQRVRRSPPQPLDAHRRTASQPSPRPGHGADRTRRPTGSGHAQRRPVLPFAVELGNLVDGMVGFLEAPVSPASLVAGGRRPEPVRPHAVRLIDRGSMRSRPRRQRRGDHRGREGIGRASAWAFVGEAHEWSSPISTRSGRTKWRRAWLAGGRDPL